LNGSGHNERWVDCPEDRLSFSVGEQLDEAENRTVLAARNSAAADSDGWSG